MGGAVENAEEPVKAALARGRVFKRADAPAVGVAGGEIAANMPFFGHRASVAADVEMFGDGGCVVAEVASIGLCPEIGVHMVDAGLMGGKAR